MRREIKSLSHFFYSSQRREQEGRRGKHKKKKHAHHRPSLLFFLHLSTMTIITAPSLDGCISARSQDTNLPPPPPSPPHPYPPTDALRSSASIAVFSSATENLPWHETNFFVPPPHRSKHLLHEQPSFLSALLSNNSKKWPRRLGERKVSI